MSTAPVTAPLVSREIAPGVTVNSGMSGAEIFQAHLNANVQPHQLGIGHTDHNVRGMSGEMTTAATGTVGGKAPPPSPAALAKQNALPTPQEQAAKIAQFDAEMRAAGKQITPSTPTAPGEFDQVGFDALTAHYKILAAGAANNPAAAARFKAAYENDVRSLYDGKRLTGEQIAKLKGGAGNVESFVPKSTPAPAAPTAPGWKNHVEQGEWVGLDKLTVADTSGYTIPQFVKDQRVHVSTFELLKQAKAAGISQAQVDAVMREQAKNAGWVKA